MRAARRSVVVGQDVDETRRRWLEFTGSRGRPNESRRTEAVSERLPAELEAGRAFFSSEGPATTRVTMELRFNPRAVEDAGRSEDWVGLRIEMYLRRFKDFVGREGL